MDQPDASKTRSAGAPVFFCRGSRRLQTTTPSILVHSRLARSLTLTSHRVPADDTSTPPRIVIVRLRPVRPGKHELRRTDRTLHTIHILHSSRTMGRILRKHARTSLRLSLPDPTPTIFEVALSPKILWHVRSFCRALPDTPLDLGPHSHRRASLRTLALERDTPHDPPKVNSRNRNHGRSAGRPEEHPLRHPHRRRRPSNQTTYQCRPILVLGEHS